MEPTKNRSAHGTMPPDNGASGAKHIAHEAKQLATDVVDRARDLAEHRVSDTQQRSADQIGDVAKALRGASENLGDSFAAPLMQRAARALDQVSGSVGGASLPDTIRATERFARREPLLFLGGAFAVGLLAARFLRSSSRRGEMAAADDDFEYDAEDRYDPYDRDDRYVRTAYELGTYEGPYGRAQDNRAMAGRMDLDRRTTMPMGASSGTNRMPGDASIAGPRDATGGSVTPPIPAGTASPTMPDGIGKTGSPGADQAYPPPPIPGGTRRS